MKTLSINEMQGYCGGGNQYINGFCAGIGIVESAAFFGLLAFTPVGAAVVGGVAVGCVAYGVYSGLN